MAGIIVILISFVVAGILRVVLKRMDECMMAKFIPQLIMLCGGLIGAYLFLTDNWSQLG